MNRISETQVRKHLATWQSRLGLDDWNIAMVFEETVEIDERPCQMSVKRSQHYKRATIKVSRSTLAVDTMADCIEKDLLVSGELLLGFYLEQGIVHELLHLILRDVMEVSDIVREDIHPSSRSVWDSAFSRAEEATVDSLARALVENWGT